MHFGRRHLPHLAFPSIDRINLLHNVFCHIVLLHTTLHISLHILLHILLMYLSKLVHIFFTLISLHFLIVSRFVGLVPSYVRAAVKQKYWQNYRISKAVNSVAHVQAGYIQPRACVQSVYSGYEF